MADFFRSIFSCCIRTSDESREEPNEHTQLLPPSEGLLPTRSYVADSQKMKERMGTIVRAKEGKMVNVNAPLPFNIHNKPHHRIDGRSDRSLSTHRDPSYPGASTSRMQPGSPTAPAFQRASSARMPSYSRSRDPSPSIQTSHSTSSLHPGDASYLPPEADADGGRRGPLFDVRVVRGAGGFGIGNGNFRHGRRGNRGGLDRFNEERRRTPSQASDGYDETTKPEDRMLYTGNADGVLSEQELALKMDAPPVCDGSIPGEENAPADATAPIPHFKIQGVGKIAESWGD
ncbi:hypothetical protein OBBRIDRAFT_836112 [Obba rivulosa]|uniref:Uncharacterized protein n=1 Tax=Obba rivulosa TaxID=1052685 RepID=A0A8E2AQG8_9APHY|nr:hypothetical protein OBBRIDRAFT_836112 [Obba rivulosa]